MERHSKNAGHRNDGNDCGTNLTISTLAAQMRIKNYKDWY